MAHDSRRIALQQARAAAQALGDGVLSQTAVRRRHAARWPTIPTSCCSTAPGVRRCRSPAPTACRHLQNAGNVLRPYTALKLSFRLPPGVDRASGRERRQADAGARSAVRRAGRRSTSNRAWAAGTRRPRRPGWKRRFKSASQRVLRPRRDVHGRRRHDPVHGHAEREISAHAVPGHRRARARSQTRTARTNSWTSRPASA